MALWPAAAAAPQYIIPSRITSRRQAAVTSLECDTASAFVGVHHWQIYTPQLHHLLAT